MLSISQQWQSVSLSPPAGESGDYGTQRLWGSVGWGLMGPIGGLVVDWWSGAAMTKDYTPAFILVFAIVGLDVLVSTRLKVLLS